MALRARYVCLTRASRSPAQAELIFVGALIRRKACYLGVRGLLALRSNAHILQHIGDGPSGEPEELARSLGRGSVISGWLARSILKRLRARIGVLPAIREGGRGRGLLKVSQCCVPVS